MAPLAGSPLAASSLAGIEHRTWMHVYVANAVGGVLVAAYVVTANSRSTGTSFFAAFVTLCLLALVVGVVTRHHARAAFRPVHAWWDARRTPLPSERAAAIGIPDRAALLTLLYWVAIAVAVGVVLSVATVTSTARVVGSSIGIALAGGVSSVLARLLAERDLRPVFAMALRGTTPERRGFFGVNRLLILCWIVGSGVPLAGIVLSPLVFGEANRTVVSTTMLGVIALVAGLGFTIVAARSVSEPLERVRVVLEDVATGDLDVEVPVDDDGEIGRLQAGVNHLVDGLRERERLRDLFGRQVGHDVAQASLDRGVALGGEEREVTVLFVDIIGSTDLAANSAPADVVRLLNQFFTIVVEVVSGHGGMVNKFEGDGALAVFGAPIPADDHATCALRAGRELARRLAEEAPSCPAGIGIAGGPVVAGNIGHRHRFEYTVIGGPVNNAARLTEHAKIVPHRTCAEADLLATCAPDEAVHWELSTPVTLRGHRTATAIAVPAAAPVRPRAAGN